MKNKKIRLKKKKFKVLVTERYYITHTVEVMATDETNAREEAESIDNELDLSRLEFEEAESYVLDKDGLAK